MGDVQTNTAAKAPAEPDMPSYVSFALPSMICPDWPCHWAVQNTGNASLDLARGFALAEEGIRYARHFGTPITLIAALAELGRRGSFGCVEVGFLQRIASAAMAGRLN